MPKADEIQVIAELTHLSVHAVRAVNGTIEAGGECMLENRQGVETLLASVTPANRTDEFRVVSVWPDATTWHLSTDTEAFLDRTGDSLIKIAAASRGESKDSFAYAACNAGDGRSITSEGTVKWVLASSARDNLDDLTEGLPGHRVSWIKSAPAALARVGGIAAALRGVGKGSVALWDLGTRSSYLIHVSSGGIEGVAACSIGVEQIFQAIQSALKLKFRGAGARLFVTEGYDFTDAAPQISAAVGPAFKQAFALLGLSDPPPALACLGLTGRQAWFLREMAAAAGTSLWEPDLAKVTANLGLKYADEKMGGSFTAASIGLLELLFARIRGKDTWQPQWVEAEIPRDELEETEPEKEVVPFVPPSASAFRAKPSLAQEAASPPPPVVPKPPRPVPVPVIETMDEPAVEIPVPGAVASAVAPPPAPPPPLSAGLHTPPPDAGTPVFPLPGAPTAPAPVRRLPPVKVAPKPAVAAPPVEAAPTPVPFPEDEKELGKSRFGFYIALVAGAALVFAVIAVVVHTQLEKIRLRDRAEQAEHDHHILEEQIKAEARERKAKEDQAQKDTQAAIAQAQKQTEVSTRKAVLAEVEAQKVAAQPGGLILATAPAGASVSLDGKAPLLSPLSLTGLDSGTHHLRVMLTGYDPLEITVEIRGSQTTDLGTLALESALGQLTVTSSPDDLEFSVRPAETPSGPPLRTGRTPATLEGLPRGAYQVTYSRLECRDHVETATVRKGGKTSIDTKYVDGSLELTSDPSGAWVEKDGLRLGSTPLVLHDLTPKKASFELTLPGYDPTPIGCDIPEGQTLKVNALLLRRDRVFTSGEVKTLPVSYISPAPDLTPTQRKMDAEVTVSLIVQRDGTVVNVKVVKATDDDIGRRCANAVSRWRYHPGTAADDRTVDVRLEVPFKFAALP